LQESKSLLGAGYSEQRIDYGYDAVYQLTSEVVRVNNGAAVTNAWTYDEAGNVHTASGPFGQATATVNADNELTGWSQGIQQMTVLGQVNPGVNNSKWFGSTASAQGHSAPVSMQDGSFGIAGVPVNSGQNLLTAIVQDVSGNTATQTVNFTVGNSPSATFSYDLNGNLSSVSSASSVLNYSYDAENRLSTVVSNGITVLECWYDGTGHRIAKREIIGTQTNTWQYVWDGWNLIAVLGSDGSLKEFYTRGVGIAGDIGTLVAATHYGTPTTTYYLHNNHRGDVIMARQGTNTVATLDYAPYGELRNQSGAFQPRFRFSSKEYDASTGFYHFPYRYYAPQWARWISRDPVGDLGSAQVRDPGAGMSNPSGFPEGENAFAYVRNCPTSYTDSLGLLTFHGCSPTQQSLIESAFRSYCDKVASPEFARCVGDDRLVQQLRQMCSSSAPHIVCDSATSSACADGNTCGAALTSGRTIHICPLGFSSGRCGPLGSTIMHELTHTRGGSECMSEKVEGCLR
jgi:RHS repeat-associated protein